MTRSLKGILILLVGLTVFAGLNGVVKDQAQRIPIPEIIFFRNLFGLVPLLLLLPANGGLRSLRPHRFSLHIAQALCMSGTLVTAYMAFALVPLAEATAIMFLQPIIVALLAHFLLREEAGPMTWVAAVLGFLGVLVIAQPSSLTLAPGMGAALAAAILAALAMLFSRRLADTNTALTIAIWYMLLSTALFAPILPFYWQTPSGADLVGLMLMGLVSGLGQFLLILPFRYTSAVALAPFQYFSILGGLLVGYLWFGEVPGLMAFAGMGIVVLAMALILPWGGLRRLAPQPPPA